MDKNYKNPLRFQVVKYFTIGSISKVTRLHPMTLNQFVWHAKHNGYFSKIQPALAKSLALSTPFNMRLFGNNDRVSYLIYSKKIAL